MKKFCHLVKLSAKDTLGNSSKLHVIKTTFAHYSRVTAKKHDSKLPRDY